jgi:alpha-L-rhamnosidase
MQEVAGVLNREKDAEMFKGQVVRARGKIHDTWYNPEDSTYANGEQPYLIFPLKTGITPEHLKEAVFNKYVRTLLVTDGGHLNTGMIGTQIMTDYLYEIGRNDLVDTYVNKKTYPGWGYMVECGASTCWEQWNGNYSQIHSCFPYIGGWFYKGLGGIRWDPEAPGFKNVILKPALVESVEWVDCEYTSDYGKIVSNWKIEDREFKWKIRVPANSTATVYIPGKEIREGKLSITQSEGISFLREEENCSVFKFPSGTFTIQAQL